MNAILKKSVALIAVLAVAAAFVWNYSTIRTVARWALWSHDYKSRVLAQPVAVNGELRHIEWDAWGYPGAGNTTVYLVFDPTDSLLAAAVSHQPGKLGGIPCEVPSVRRMESHWYTVQFYTDESWGKCN